jgi:hypothetical protein
MVVVWPDEYRPRWVQPGGLDRQLVSFVDFGPSFLALAGVPVPESMGGKPVLVDADVRREYVFASKDRLDEHRFRERAVRDKRFKYIRNLMPGRPGATHITYRDRLDIMTELWRQFEAGNLSPEQSAWFETRPAEELYDTLEDPDEVHNLAANPDYEQVLGRMRSALDAWLEMTPDFSDIDELEMARAMWPDGSAPVTPPPQTEFVPAGKLVLRPGAPGASLAWRKPDGDWHIVLPGEPVNARPGETVYVKSVRYGWQESDEEEVTLR